MTFQEAIPLCDHVNSNTPRYYIATLILLLIKILKEVPETHSSVSQRFKRLDEQALNK